MSQQRVKMRIYCFCVCVLLFISKSFAIQRHNDPSYPCRNEKRPKGLNIDLLFTEDWSCQFNLNSFNFNVDTMTVTPERQNVASFDCIKNRLIRQDSKSSIFMCADKKSTNCYETLRYPSNIQARNASTDLSVVIVTLPNGEKDLLYCQFHTWYSWKHQEKLPAGITQELTSSSSQPSPTTSSSPSTTQPTPEKKLEVGVNEIVKNIGNKIKTNLAESRSTQNAGTNYLPALFCLGMVAFLLLIISLTTIFTIVRRNKKSKQNYQLSNGTSADEKKSTDHAMNELNGGVENV